MDINLKATTMTDTIGTTDTKDMEKLTARVEKLKLAPSKQEQRDERKKEVDEIKKKAEKKKEKQVYQGDPAGKVEKK